MREFMLHTSVFTLSSTADCDLRAELFFLGLMTRHKTALTGWQVMTPSDEGLQKEWYGIIKHIIVNNIYYYYYYYYYYY
jgi:hypothetical protein